MQKKENKLAKNAVTIFIVVLMVGSVLGYMFGRDSGESLKYNEYKFLRKGNKFVLNVNKADVEFDYFPSDVENIKIDPAVLGKFSDKAEIDSTYDKDSKFKEAISVAQFDLERFFNLVGIYFVNGLTSENDFKMPVLGCENATEKIPIIYFRESNETKIFLKDNCIIAESNTEIGFIRIKDRIIYGLLGVIKNG